MCEKPLNFNLLMRFLMLFMQKSKKMEGLSKEEDSFDSLKFGLSILKKILESKPWNSIHQKSSQAEGKDER